MADIAIYYLALACVIALLACFTILPVLCIFRRARPIAGAGYVICSFVFGGSLWIVSVMTVYVAWGTAAVIVGLFFFGVGAFPMSIWISFWHSDWMAIATGLGMLVATIGARFLGLTLTDQK